MISNFDIYELNRTFSKNDGWTITNHNDRFVIVVNVKKFFIAEIFRTSPNYYEVITANPTVCQRICLKKFSDAVIWINCKLNEI